MANGNARNDDTMEAETPGEEEKVIEDQEVQDGDPKAEDHDKDEEMVTEKTRD
jgi:hypothetical protein